MHLLSGACGGGTKKVPEVSGQVERVQACQAIEAGNVMNWAITKDLVSDFYDPDFGTEREILWCQDCRELVVLGDTGMTCGCGEKIQYKLPFKSARDPYKQFPHQRSVSPADKMAGKLIGAIRRQVPQ